MKTAQIVVPKTFNTIYKWECTQTYHRCEDVVTKEFYKFVGEIPTDRIFVSYNKNLPVNEETIVKCLDEVINRALECCFIDFNGKTNTFLLTVNHTVKDNEVETSLIFGKEHTF